MNKAALLVVMFLTWLISGCATVADAQAAKGTGLSKTYAKEYKVVWNTVLEVLNETNLSLVSEDQNTGVILAETEWDARTYGERVAIFVEAVPGQKNTKVEIVNKRAWGGEIFVRQWDDIIIENLDKTLQ